MKGGEDKVIMNKKGLSTVVVTLIMVLLVIVSIALVWFVVQNLIKNQPIEVRAKCIENIVTASNVVCAKAGTCKSITLNREGTGNEVISGVLVGVEGDAGKKTFEETGNIDVGGAKVVTSGGILGITTANPKKVETRVILTDSKGEKVTCDPSVAEFTAKDCITTNDCTTVDKAKCDTSTYSCVKCTADADCLHLGNICSGGMTCDTCPVSGICTF